MSSRPHAAASPEQPSGNARLRTDVPHSARVYDYWLGGKDNFAADRALATQIEKAVPAVPAMARANRAFMQRATRHLVNEAGVRQFLDIGTGIPTRPNLHDVAQDTAPGTRVVYVDNDPLVLVHARALLTSAPQGRCDYLDADLRDPVAILNSSQVRETLDLTQPVAITFGSILMLLPDEADPWTKVMTLMHATPTGSYLVLSHPTADFDPAAMAKVTKVTGASGFTFVPRPYHDVERFFHGCQLIEPGLVPVLDWRADETPADARAVYYWAGVARK